MNRKRRTAAEIARLREFFFKTVTKAGPITLNQLMASHAKEVGINDSPSGKNLVKRQLSLLAKDNQIEFRRQGRDLLAGPLRARLARRVAAPTEKKVKPPVASPRPAAQRPLQPPTSRTTKASVASQQQGQLEAIRAYARTVESFSSALQNQVGVLVRIVEKLAD